MDAITKKARINFIITMIDSNNDLNSDKYTEILNNLKAMNESELNNEFKKACNYNRSYLTI